jgi:hypothetical protein
MTRARPLLAVRRSIAIPTRAERLGWLVLAILACVLAHEASYQLMYRGTESYRAAMTLLGHDGYWVGLSGAIAVATLALAGVAAVQLRRLTREAASTPALAPDEAAGPAAYLRLVAATWLRLALLALLIFTAQENLEAILAGLPLRGIDVVLGHGMTPLLVILGATLLMAFAVALVRWRRRVLLGRLAAASRAWARATVGRVPVAAHPVRALHVAGAWGSRAPPTVVAIPAL